jgi:hypothetical protein
MKRALNDRLRRIRERAQLARITLASIHTEPRNDPPTIDPLPPLPSRAELLCGRRCDMENGWSPGRRSNARVWTTRRIALRRLGCSGLEITLRDISTSGFRVDRSETLIPGRHLVARLPGLEPLGATVSWIDDRSAGLQFDRPLHPAVFELLLTRLF